MLGRILFALVLFCPAAVARAQDAGIEFFEKKIRPLLAEHCLSCHSAEGKKVRGGLNMDSKEAFLKGGDSGTVIVPGRPNDSLLIKAVRYADAELKMPPKGKLPAVAIADLEKWVALGAPDPRAAGAARSYKAIDLEAARKFWAFHPPRLAALPALKGTNWPRSDIDRFILARLENSRIKPARDADRLTLVRRAYFDLIGLPPTPEQVDAFLSDQTPEAFARVIDQLLASPHFGERWGRHWLDVVRFSESTGGGRSMLLREAWRYRDYVIAAFNTDKAFNRFILEQVAGDLLDAKTSEERMWNLIALAFWVLGPTNYERQDKPILEMDVIDEQLDTMGRAFLGMTIGCARCHDHKFDPIPTSDYYALAGILKSTRTLIHENVSKWVEKPLPLPAGQEAAFRKHDAAVAALKRQIEQVREMEKKAGISLAKGVVAVVDLPGIVVDDAQAKKIGPWKQSKFTGSYIGDGYLYDDRGFKDEKTLTFIPEFTRAGRYEVRLAYVPHENRDPKVPVRIFHADGDHTIHVNQKQEPPIDGRFISLGSYRFEKGSQWFVMLSTQGARGHVVADAVQFLPEESDVSKPATKSEGKGPSSRELEAKLKKLLAGGPQRPMAMCVSEADTIGDFHVCVRGNVHNRGEKVKRGFIQVATIGPPPAIPAGESGRRQLAHWLAAPGNPLTARVFVNRIWYHLFGAGLVRTVDNFGATGERPSHPELLDHLASRFVNNGWSVKKLIRGIMLSRTYEMASDGEATGIAADPENRLFWRQNRRRLEAECIRDAILAVSGQLDRTLGGNAIKKGTAVERDYQFDDLRRSVYTPIFRNRLNELFEVFDFADPNLVVGKRSVSTVPTQALYLMNSPFVMDQARQAARTVLAAADIKDEQRIERAYRVVLGRPPSVRERQLAANYLTRAGANAEERMAAWERFYQTLFACLDFRYVN